MTDNHSLETPFRSCTAFQDDRLLSSGSPRDVAVAVQTATLAHPAASILTFDDRSGAVIDFDLRGSAAEVQARLAGLPEGTSAVDAASSETASRGRGRPRLGVVSREVTLLPRHWDWLAAQSGGASHALRRLVEEARLRDGGQSRQRLAREAAYCFMSAMAGNRPGFEEASRALFAGDEARFLTEVASWPEDIRKHIHRLGWGAAQAGPSG
ncbi:DUF2239 family protein [Bosea sp. 124]|uniref:DUF2239 family protein n=1 Tax=Bosea sp. 124 TaxID=2135642 RepID=UPI000D36AB38|nr:DUF2239 family protein [Bosea sp. 124]PTM39129.1 hypothetical protein C8D03_0606 [Bosea sp. 124]